MLRRWKYPCNKYRYSWITINFRTCPALMIYRPCIVYLNYIALDEEYPLCSASFFEDLLGTNVSNVCGGDLYQWSCSPSPSAYYVAPELVSLFNHFLNEPTLKTNKYLLITDEPTEFFNNYDAMVYNRLQNYTDHLSGPPLTVIGIDNKKFTYNTNVSSYYAPLFPPSQAQNLLEVKNITKLLSDSYTTVNYCLAPWLVQPMTQSVTSTELQPITSALKPSHVATIVGSIVALIAILLLTVLTLSGIIFLIKKRNQRIRARRITDEINSMQIHYSNMVRDED
jgi:hypothetical protein